ELLGDVRRRDGAEELALFADARREGELHLLEPLRDVVRGAAALVLARLEAVTLLRDPLEVARRRLVGEAARQQEVACVSVLDRDDVAWLSQVLDCLTENDFHEEPQITDYVVERTRLRQSAQVSPSPSPNAASARSMNPSTATGLSIGHQSLAKPTSSAAASAPGARNQESTPKPRMAYSAPKKTRRLRPVPSRNSSA